MSFIPTNIKVLREEARITQEEFAEKLAVSLETVKLWEKGKLTPTSEEITRMCPILRIHEEDFLERDILSERNNAGSRMKKNGNRSTYDWYYGNRVNFAFYLSYLIVIPLVIVISLLVIGNITKPLVEEGLISNSYKIGYQIIITYLIEGFISGIYLVVYIFKRKILRFQWWFIFWLSPAVAIITLVSGFLMIGFYGYAFYRAIIKKGKNH